MSETTYYQRNREVMLNRANKYYKNNKEILRETAKNKYRELSEEEKNVRREYGRNRYHNMSEEKKQRLREYQKYYCETKNIFHRCKRSIDIKDTDHKGAFQNCYYKDIFISASINF